MRYAHHWRVQFAILFLLIILPASLPVRAVEYHLATNGDDAVLYLKAQ